MKVVQYVNLTSGLELYTPGMKLVRIQSSHLESKALWKVIFDLDYGFLFDAALNHVSLYDCGPRGVRPDSRAQWQGVPWIAYAYYKTTTGKELPSIDPKLRSHFRQVYSRTCKERTAAMNKLYYVWKLTKAEKLRITCVSMNSEHDGDYDYFSDLLKRKYV